jgi:hypothetical protein
LVSCPMVSIVVSFVRTSGCTVQTAQECHTDANRECRCGLIASSSASGAAPWCHTGCELQLDKP